MLESTLRKYFMELFYRRCLFYLNQILVYMTHDKSVRNLSDVEPSVYGLIVVDMQLYDLGHLFYT